MFGGAPKLDLDRLKAVWNRGLTAAEAAAEFNVGVNSIYVAARRHGLVFASPRKTGRPGSFSLADAQRLLAEGKSTADVARQLGVSKSAVSRKLRRASRPLVAPIPPDLKKETTVPKPAPEPGNGLSAAQMRALRKLAHPDWTIDEDMAVLGTGGRYADLNALAGLLERPMATLQARWHRVRVVR